MESADGKAPTSTEGVHLIAEGTAAAVLGPAMDQSVRGAVLSTGGGLLFGPSAGAYKSLAIFRLRIDAGAPPSLYVLASIEPGRFEGEQCESDLRFFASALERAIRAWLDLPRP